MPNQEKSVQNKETKSLKSWAEDDRPREKLMLKGKAALSDAELLAIIMGSGSREETVVDLAKRILRDYQNNWHELGRLNMKDLCKYKGVGEAKAISIITALEIGRRKAKQLALDKPKIIGSYSVFEVFRPIMADLQVEEFWVMFLSKSNKVLSVDKMSLGSIDKTLVDQRVIFKKAIEMYAVSIILAHNHPSGNENPSRADKELTQKMKKAGEILDIQVLDHLIITPNKYYSFADKGIM